MADIILSPRYVEVFGVKLERDIFIKTTLKKVSEMGSALSYSDLDWAIKMEDAFVSQADLSDKQIVVLFNIFQRGSTRTQRRKERGEY